jgi:hypothetical protein
MLLKSIILFMKQSEKGKWCVKFVSIVKKRSLSTLF